MEQRHGYISSLSLDVTHVQTAHSDCPFSYSILGLSKWKDQAMQKMALVSLRARTFVTGESGMSKLHSVLILNHTGISGCLYSPGNFLLCHCH